MEDLLQEPCHRVLRVYGEGAFQGDRGQHAVARTPGRIREQARGGGDVLRFDPADHVGPERAVPDLGAGVLPGVIAGRYVHQQQPEPRDVVVVKRRTGAGECHVDGGPPGRPDLVGGEGDRRPAAVRVADLIARRAAPETGAICWANVSRSGSAACPAKVATAATSVDAPSYGRPDGGQQDGSVQAEDQYRPSATRSRSGTCTPYDIRPDATSSSAGVTWSGGPYPMSTAVSTPCRATVAAMSAATGGRSQRAAKATEGPCSQHGTAGSLTLHPVGDLLVGHPLW